MRKKIAMPGALPAIMDAWGTNAFPLDPVRNGPKPNKYRPHMGQKELAKAAKRAALKARSQP